MKELYDVIKLIKLNCYDVNLHQIKEGLMMIKVSVKSPHLRWRGV